MSVLAAATRAGCGLLRRWQTALCGGLSLAAAAVAAGGCHHHSCHYGIFVGAKLFYAELLDLHAIDVNHLCCFWRHLLVR